MPELLFLVFLLIIIKMFVIKIIGKVNDKLLEKRLTKALRMIIVVVLYAVITAVVINGICDISNEIVSNYCMTHHKSIEAGIGGVVIDVECECSGSRGEFLIVTLLSELIATIICAVKVWIKKFSKNRSLKNK